MGRYSDSLLLLAGCTAGAVCLGGLSSISRPFLAACNPAQQFTVVSMLWVGGQACLVAAVSAASCGLCITVSCFRVRPHAACFPAAGWQPSAHNCKLWWYLCFVAVAVCIPCLHG